MSFQVQAVSFRYPHATVDALNQVELQVPDGAFYAIIGPNGCGKTTLLRLLLGALAPGAGTVRYDGRPVGEWPRNELARRVGVVAQIEPLAFPLTVRELVGMGRYPHLGAWGAEGPADRAAVDAAMATCDVVGLADRPMDTLSGGERQRARVARALAQEPDTLVLDEPTASLDIAHEMGIFELLRGLADRSVTVVIVTHNLNIAARYADRMLLLNAGRTAAEGEPAAVFTAHTLETVYRWPLTINHLAGDGSDAGSPQVVPRRPWTRYRNRN
jgi:ABC-type cobalamin/Fe3+-siderophores transport system ATPase subunit